MEELGHEELQRRLEQEDDPQRRRHPGVAGAEPGEEEHGHGAEGCHRHLGHVQEVDAVTEPGERGEQEISDGRVMPEHLQAPHGHEAPEVGEQPDALVVDPHVEVHRPEPLVLEHHQAPEDHDPRRDRQAQDHHCSRLRARRASATRRRRGLELIRHGRAMVADVG